MRADPQLSKYREAFLSGFRDIPFDAYPVKLGKDPYSFQQHFTLIQRNHFQQYEQNVVTAYNALKNFSTELFIIQFCINYQITKSGDQEISKIFTKHEKAARKDLKKCINCMFNEYSKNKNDAQITNNLLQVLKYFSDLQPASGQDQAINYVRTAYQTYAGKPKNKVLLL